MVIKMLKIKTRNLYILYNNIKDLYRLEFLGYNTIAVFFSLLAYISPFIFLYHFLGNQIDFSTQLISILYGFRFDFLTKIAIKLISPSCYYYLTNCL